MRGRLNSLLLSLSILGALAIGPGAASPAAADSGGCTSSLSGGTVTGPPTISGGTITISQSVHVIFGNYCPSGETSNDASWTPPACWWAPVFTPEALKAWAYAYYQTSTSTDLTWQQMVQYYETDGGKGENTPPGYKSTDGPPFSNWNIGATPGGMWWSLVFNEDMIGTPQFTDCLLHTDNTDGEPWSWVPDATGGPNNVTEPLVTQGELAQYAASIMQLPASVFNSSPDAGQTRQPADVGVGRKPGTRRAPVRTPATRGVHGLSSRRRTALCHGHGNADELHHRSRHSEQRRGHPRLRRRMHDKPRRYGRNTVHGPTTARPAAASRTATRRRRRTPTTTRPSP